MGRLFSLTPVWLFLLASFAWPATTQAQVLVYKLDLSNAKGINFHTFEGGYFVAPLLGGGGTFLLTTSEEGRQYIESAEGGRLFTALGKDGERKAVVSAATGGGTATGSLVAYGDINHLVKVNSPTSTLTARVARTMNGTLVSADDESSAETTAANGTIGTVGVADVKISLDEEETNAANKDGLTLEQAVEHLKLELERQGYSRVETGTDIETSEDEPATPEENASEVVTPAPTPAP